MENGMNKYIIAMIILAMTATVIEAGPTTYDVKVKNKNIEEGFNLNYVRVETREPLSAFASCSCSYGQFDTADDCAQLIPKGDSIQISCSANAIKWKRRIEVNFECGEDGERHMWFPRGKKWYDRDHLIKKNNRYVVKIKKSDC
jgi:hypothetical protein